MTSTNVKTVRYTYKCEQYTYFKLSDLFMKCQVIRHSLYDNEAVGVNKENS